MKRKSAVEADNVELFVVKSGLQSIIPNPQIRSQIERDVVEMSALAYEASHLIYFTIYQRLYDNEKNFDGFKFLDYFYQLQKNSKDKYQLPDKYLSMRGTLQKYDGAGRSNIFINLASQYETVFKNNLWMHDYPRVRKLLKRLNPDADNSEIYRNLHYLFNEKPLYQKTLNFHFNWERGHFVGVKKNPIKFVYDFFKIQQLNESNEWKNFTLVPLFSSGRKHIQYDRRSFHAMLGKLKLTPKTINARGREVNVSDRDFNWNDFIRVKKNFHGSFTTDGVSICVRYDRQKRLAAEVPHKKIRREYDCQIGIDPGLRLFVAAVKNYPDGSFENLKISNATYQYENGAHIRKQKRLKWTASLDEIIENDRATHELPISSTMSSNYEGFIAFKLKWMALKQTIYTQKKVARLKFDEYRRKHQTLSNYVNKQLVGKAKNVAVYFGDASVVGNSPARGYVRVPGKELRKKLKEHPKIDLIIVDEFRTSKKCSFCYADLNMYPIKRFGESHPHRFTSCPSCKRVCHRDINAANNILQLGKMIPERPVEFTRNG